MKVFRYFDPDSIYPCHLKELKNKIIEPLTAIYNISDGAVPHDFQTVNVTYLKGEINQISQIIDQLV